MCKNSVAFSSVKKLLPLIQGKFLILFVLASVIFCFTSAANTANAATYYVDAVNGSDGNPGTSALPWKTIAKAQQAVHYGPATILLRNGDYGQFYENFHTGEISDGSTPYGTRWYLNEPPRTEWIIYKADIGHTPVIQSLRVVGQVSNYFDCFFRFEGIKITGRIKLDYIRYFQLVNCNVDMGKPFSRSSVIEPTGQYITISGNQITNSWIGVYAEMNDSSITNNHIYNLGSYGIHLKGGQNVLIENNHIHDIRNKTYDFENFYNRPVWNCSPYVFTRNDSQLGAIFNVDVNFTTGLMAYLNFDTPLDLSNILEMVYTITSSANLDANNLNIRLSDQTNGGTGGTFYDIPLPSFAAGKLTHNFVRTLPDKFPGIINLQCRSVAMVFSQDPGLCTLTVDELGLSDGIHTGIIGLWGTEDNVTIRNNNLHSVKALGLFISRTGSYDHITFENNLLYDAASGIITIENFGGELIFRNNTIVGSYRLGSKPEDENYTTSCGIEFAEGYDGSRVKIFNNIVVGSMNITQVNGTLVTKTWQENSNIYQSGPPLKGSNSLEVKSMAGVSFRNDFFVLPDFTRWTTTAVNYSLKAGSPAINRGDPSNAPEVDILGNLRDAQPDVGCYEYNSVAQGYSISIRAINGTVTKTPNKVSYNAGESVILLATPASGYSFLNWSGDVTDINNAVTIVMNSNKMVTANFAANTYMLSVSSPNGSVSKSPNKNSYTSGEVVTLTAAPDTGYHFSSWSGDASGTSSSTTIVMNGNKSVTANFALNTFTLSVNSIHGSVTKTPGKTFYNYGEQVTLNATPVTGYHFVQWSGDAAGTDNPTTITMNGNKTVSANFEINTYNLQTNSVFGTITKTPDKLQYNYGETVTLQANPYTGHIFTGWSGDASGNLNPLTLTMTSSKSITANFFYTLADNNAPYISKSNSYPHPNAIQVPLNSLIYISLVDEGQGIDGNSVSISVNGSLVYTGNVYNYTTAIGLCRRIGNISNYIYVFQAYQSFSYDQTITISLTASDLAGNTMNDSYSFKTEMLSFGKNVKVNSDSSTLLDGHPSTVSDGSGNLYSCWHEGAAGNRDIYFGKLTGGTTSFAASIRLTTDPCDQCNPVIARDSTNKLYVAWQDYRRGNWDIYVSTSLDAVNWSAAVRISDSNYNQTNPVIAIDRNKKAYVAWQEDQDGNQDIFAASSTNAFLTEAVFQITSNIFDQTEPAIAIDATNTAYVFWMDSRNGSKDIFAASSNNGWVNIPIVTGVGDQYEPAVAAEDSNPTLHLLWVDNSSGNNNILYAPCTGGLHSLSGTNIIDDTTGADQDEPSIIVKGNSGTNLRVFACWRDKRNSDADLYFAQVGFGSATNIFVGDDGTRSAQATPAIGIDSAGYPYILWVDSRNTSPDIFFAGCTYTLGNPILAANVPANSDVLIGKSPSAITSLNDISVNIPAGAYSCDVNITVAKVENPPNLGTTFFSSQYEFGPSGIVFEKPVTITIPYLVSASSPATAYWYDSLTDTSSQSGITNIEDITVSDNLHAIRFKTTHFTSYFVGPAGDSSSGGGCSLAHPGQKGNIVEYILPFLILMAAVTFINRRDRRVKKCAQSKM